MYDVAKCKNAIEYLANRKGDKLCMLLLKKWHILKELIIVLQFPYKATISLQRRSLTLSGAYGIWKKMFILLNMENMQRVCQTNFRACLIDALHHRSKNICDNSLMCCALVLHPRYRQEILQDEEKTGAVTQLLQNLWHKIEFLRSDNQAINQRYMVHNKNIKFHSQRAIVLGN